MDVLGERKLTMEEWHARFFDAARHFMGWSKDPRRGVGAIVVDDLKRPIAVGINGFPRGVRDTADRLGNVDLKRKLTVHAELNAVLNAPNGVRGCALYSTSWPCHECAKAIIQSGIAVVVAPRPDYKHPTWGESNRISWELLNEAGVTLIMLDLENQR